MHPLVLINHSFVHSIYIYPSISLSLSLSFTSISLPSISIHNRVTPHSRPHFHYSLILHHTYTLTTVSYSHFRSLALAPPYHSSTCSSRHSHYHPVTYPSVYVVITIRPFGTTGEWCFIYDARSCSHLVAQYPISLLSTILITLHLRHRHWSPTSFASMFNQNLTTGLWIKNWRWTHLIGL